MKRANIGCMDAYETLRRKAKANRAQAIAAAHERYRLAIRSINVLNGMMEDLPEPLRPKDIRRSPQGTPFNKLKTLEAAEQVLIDSGPLTIAAST